MRIHTVGFYRSQFSDYHQHCRHNWHAADVFLSGNAAVLLHEVSTKMFTVGVQRRCAISAS